MMRLERLRAAFEAAGIDALCVRDTSNIAYLTGFEGVFDEERAHALLITAQAAILHTDSRYAAACRQAAASTESPVAIDDEAIAHSKWLATQDLGTWRMGIEDSVSLAEFRALETAFTKTAPEAQLVETSGVVSTLRQIKDATEIARLRAAQEVTDAAFAYIISFMRPGMTERQVQLALDNFMFTHGADALAFPSIVACGANGANPHAQPTDAKLEAGQCVVMDFGARVGGYCSDMTRTVFLGEPDAKLAHAYQVLREANEAAEALIAPGVTGKQAHERAIAVLDAGGFAGAMGHGLGHGVGRDVHEQPLLSPRNEEPLCVGNVVTVEPGIYIEGGFGMRLEDFGVVTETGFEVFTQTSHNMVVL